MKADPYIDHTNWFIKKYLNDEAKRSSLSDKKFSKEFQGTMKLSNEQIQNLVRPLLNKFPAYRAHIGEKITGYARGDLCVMLSLLPGDLFNHIAGLGGEKDYWDCCPIEIAESITKSQAERILNVLHSYAETFSRPSKESKPEIIDHKDAGTW